MTRDYELGFILNPEVSEEQTRAILQRLEQIVTNYDGQVVRVNHWGRRRLAYPIQHNRDGYYVFIDMILTPETVFELDRTLKVSEEVLRHLIKRRDPKAVQKEREARAAAAAADQARAPAAASAEPATEAESEIATMPGTEGQVEIPIAEEDEAPIILSEEDLEHVPPAIEEEESIEA